jgi:hypothetical protein
VRILIVNSTLAGRTGTETAARDLALGLKAAGQTPMVYAPELGDIADEIQSSGVAVTADLARLAVAPAIVHGNHHAETVEALLRFPNARGVFVCHDRLAPDSAPPITPRLQRYVAVDYNCLERLQADYGIPDSLTAVIYNSVDTVRFRPRADLPTRPARALVFSNYAGPGTHLEAVEHACSTVGLGVDVVGSVVGNSSRAPERILGQYDLVFAKARCALEAMAVGSAVVLCDTTGLGPLVTTRDVAELRRWNFGRRVLREPLDSAAVRRQVDAYDPTDAALVSRYIREHADLSGAVARYLRLYDTVMTMPLPEARPFSSDLNVYLRGIAARVGRLELELRSHRRPERMEELSDDECGRLTLSLESCPEDAASDGIAWVRVRLENHGQLVIGSFAPFPVQLSYRWFRSGSEGAIVPNGTRTPLSPALPRGSARTYSMRVAVPAEPGEYRLRVTLVQEYRRWLDDLPHPVSAEATVRVLASPSRSNGLKRS